MKFTLKEIFGRGNGFEFSRGESMQMKGIAIMVMLFLHLFNSPGKIASATPLIYLGETPLVLVLGRFAGICVGLYLFLSGFGQYCLWRRETGAGMRLREQMRANFYRVRSLYKRLWMIGGLCVFLLASFGLNSFEISFASLIGNASGWRCSFNATWWFLFPWGVVCLVSPLLFKLILNGDSVLTDILKTTAVVVCGTGGGALMIAIYVAGKIPLPYWVYQIMVVLSLLPVFTLGALAAKWNLLGVFRSFLQGWGWALLPVLIVAYWFTCGKLALGVLNGYWATIFIFVFAVTPIPKFLQKCLEYLGERSVDMWFIHAFFLSAPFVVWVYAPKFPVLVFAGFLLLTLASTLVFRGFWYCIEWIFKKIIKSRLQIVTD